MKSNLFNVLLQYSFHPCKDDFKSASIANIQPAINPVASEFETKIRIGSARILDMIKSFSINNKKTQS